MENSQHPMRLYPELKASLSYELISTDEIRIQLLIPRTNWIERLSIRWFNQPDTRKIKFDALGSFVLMHCDGHHSISQIERRLKEHFGAQAEPILSRLFAFLQMMVEYGWIEIKEPG